jgi:hypothetical protein
MKRFVLVGIVALAVAASVVSATSAATWSKPLHLVLTPGMAPGNANSCCVVESDLDGTATIPSLGRVNYTGHYDVIVHDNLDLGTQGLSSHLDLTFTAANGDTFEVIADSGDFNFGEDPPPATWGISNASGRFSGLSGSGTYTVAGLDTTTLAFREAAVFSFTGTIN